MTERREGALDTATVEARLKAELPRGGWRMGGSARTYKTAGWKSTLMVINTVGHLAEAAWHHPDITASYAWVEVRLMNHAAKGITDKDFALARKIEEVVAWQPGQEGQGLEGTPTMPASLHQVRQVAAGRPSLRGLHSAALGLEVGALAISSRRSVRAMISCHPVAQPSSLATRTLRTSSACWSVQASWARPLAQTRTTAMKAFMQVEFPLRLHPTRRPARKLRPSSCRSIS